MHRKGQVQSHRLPARLCGTKGRQKVEINIEILAYNLGKNKNILISVKKNYFYL
jgi:hypothetical protein